MTTPRRGSDPLAAKGARLMVPVLAMRHDAGSLGTTRSPARAQEGAQRARRARGQGEQARGAKRDARWGPLK